LSRPARPSRAPPRRAALLLLAALSALFAASPAGADPDRAALERTLAEARRARRERLRATLGDGYALLFGQPLTDALQPPQEGCFLYLTGVEDAEAVLFLAGDRAAPPADERAGADRPPEPGAPPAPGAPTDPPPAAPAPEAPGPRETLFLRDGGEWYARFHGPRWRPVPESAAALGVARVRAAPPSFEGYVSWLSRSLPRDARLLLPAYAGPDHATVRELRARLADALRKSRPDLRIGDLAPAIVAMRAVKEPIEISFLRRAAGITAEAVLDTLPLLRPGGSEAEVDGALLHGMRRRGARSAFTFVVAAGRNGATPHYFRNESPLEENDLLVLDVGAAVERYAADITRTFPVRGVFSARQREIYELVLRAQQAAIDVVRPGASFHDVDGAARKVITAAGLGRHFIHGTSHHVGLDVHDPGPTTLETGMVITVEPGIYLPDEGFGVRIEDMLLVTESGHDLLSGTLPRSVAGVEALLAARRIPAAEETK
jgi:Xaa-Pro aminopeptidase